MTRQIIMSFYTQNPLLSVCEWICEVDLFLIICQSPFESVRSQNSVWNLELSQIHCKTTNLQMNHSESGQFWVVKF